MSLNSPPQPQQILTTLPPELLHLILTYLDIPSLLSLSRACHTLRTLSLDPILHSTRLKNSRLQLQSLLERRPTKQSICPPNAWILLSRTNVLSRRIGRKLVKVRLARELARRMGVGDLVRRGILPEGMLADGYAGWECVDGEERNRRRSAVREGLEGRLERRMDLNRVVELGILPRECVRFGVSGPSCGGNGRDGNGVLVSVCVSPKLIEVRRRVMRERLKDGLRAWLKKRALLEQRRRMERDEEEGGSKVSVRDIVRRFTARKAAMELEDSVQLEKKKAQARWGREAEIARRKEESRFLRFGVCGQPTRAHVLGLRRFWEGVIRAAGG